MKIINTVFITSCSIFYKFLLLADWLRAQTYNLQAFVAVLGSAREGLYNLY